jgi:hypothetical protein
VEWALIWSPLPYWKSQGRMHGVASEAGAVVQDDEQIQRAAGSEERFLAPRI